MISLERILFELKLIYKKIRVRKKYPNVINTIIDKRVSLSTSAVINGSILTGNVKIGENVLFNSVNIVGNVSIGDYSAKEGPTNILGSFEKIEIGKFCSIGWGCNIINHNHKFKRPSSHYFSSHVLGGKIQDDIEIKGPITIGNDVWIGANVSILPGIQIGDGVIIGAGSIVTKNIPAYAIVSGNPAEIVKYRFSDNEIEQLINAKWWDWPLEKIKRNKEFFLNNYSITNLKNISE